MTWTMMVWVACEPPESEEIEIVVNDRIVTLDEDATGPVPLDVVVTGTDERPDILIVESPYFGNLVGVREFYEYIPHRDFFGSDRIRWEARLDGVAAAAAEVSVRVLPVNDLPVGESQQFSTSVDQPVSGTLDAADVEDAGLSYILAQAPNDGRVDIEANGDFTYTPDPGFIGTDAFLWQAFDSGGLTTGLVRVDLEIL